MFCLFGGATPHAAGVHAARQELMGYRVVERLGEGAGSVLYDVVEPATGHHYALKHVTPVTDKDQRFIEQLRVEFEVGSRVAHPALRRALDLKLRHNLLHRVTEGALVLELFRGDPLDQRPPGAIADVVTTFIHTAEALGALHASGHVHCDLKPSNILVGPAGEVKVIDLGQACRFGTTKPRIQGTPDYIAPEQVRCEAVTPQTDVYNLGATLYWALCGRHVPTLYTVKRGENSFLLDQKIPAPAELNPRVPEPLSNLVMECVRSKPAKRPATMREVLLRLEIARHALTRHPAAVPPAAARMRSAG